MSKFVLGFGLLKIQQNDCGIGVTVRKISMASQIKKQNQFCFYNNIVIQVMCRTNIQLYKKITKERITRQTFLNLVGKFDFHNNQTRPDKITFVPRIIKGESELNSGFASSIHSLLSPQAVHMPSMRFSNKMANNIRLILNKLFILLHSSLESHSLLCYFFKERLVLFLRFCLKLSIGCSLIKFIKIKYSFCNKRQKPNNDSHSHY